MLLLKLDISKAFDTLSCPFVLEVLQARGFGQRWCGWIASLLSSATSRIMLNCHQGQPIRHIQGVRQGDSLSPVLFIIAMDILHRLFLKASADGMLRRMRPSEDKFQCSFYADDVILFILPTHRKLGLSKRYSAFSGQHQGCTQILPNVPSHQSTAAKKTLTRSSTYSAVRSNLSPSSIWGCL